MESHGDTGYDTGEKGWRTWSRHASLLKQPPTGLVIQTVSTFCLLNTRGLSRSIRLYRLYE